jgi:membrane associated rhomboid family serine protease
MMNITPVVKQLLIINIIFYICSYLVGDEAYNLLSLFYFENPAFKPWQIITHMFMHAPVPQFAHILFNMFALYSFGSALEHFWGGKKFLFFYISCGLGAMILHTGVNYFQYHDVLNTLYENQIPQQAIDAMISKGTVTDQILELVPMQALQDMYTAYHAPMLGASGAIYGLLVAFAFMFPNAELMLIFLPIPIKAKYFVPGILLIDLFLGVSGKSLFGTSDGIAHFAHLGGAILGFLMMWYWKKNQFGHNRWN